MKTDILMISLSKTWFLLVAVLALLCCITTLDHASAQGKQLSERGKAADTHKDGLIQENEARGPHAANVDDMDFH